ncbi:MAG: Stp1/IreP family PP2C-type Ser/Thr phosphatase [Lachnospiraceae bacterium]|nr:Stp1/IreP family PP2C-type Ser/Thr phosphatase [Lachnospiraceae bacterium]
MVFYCTTNTGSVRDLNEDYCFASDAPVGGLKNLFLVADGMGGHNAGEYASEFAVKLVLDEIRAHKITDPKEALRQAVGLANRALFHRSRSDAAKAGMGTTFVAATILDGRLYVMNIGDSRLYVAYPGNMMQVTLDHSFVEEMVRNGIITRKEAALRKDRNKITRAVGVMEQVEPDFFEVDLNANAKVLMCTDGLTNMVENEKILAILNNGQNVKEQTEKLVAAAIANGGKDNITVILIDPYSV